MCYFIIPVVAPARCYIFHSTHVLYYVHVFGKRPFDLNALIKLLLCHIINHKVFTCTLALLNTVKGHKHCGFMYNPL